VGGTKEGQARRLFGVQGTFALLFNLPERPGMDMAKLMH